MSIGKRPPTSHERWKKFEHFKKSENIVSDKINKIEKWLWKMNADSTNLDIASLETTVSDIMKIKYVKMWSVQFKVVFSDILESAASSWNLESANLELTVNSTMITLQIGKRRNWWNFKWDWKR